MTLLPLGTANTPKSLMVFCNGLLLSLEFQFTLMENLQISCVCFFDLRFVMDFEVGKVLLVEQDYILIRDVQAAVMLAPGEGLYGFD